MTDTNRPAGTWNANPEGIGFWSLVGEDRRTQEHGLASQGFWALYAHRFGNWRMGQPKPIRMFATLFYLILAKLVQITCGIDLPYSMRLGRRIRLEHFGGMILVAEAVGDDTIIRQNTTFGIKKVAGQHERPVIGKRVDIGAGAVLIGGIKVGDDAVIGANAVVISDIPAGAVAVGVPAKVIKQSSDES